MRCPNCGAVAREPIAACPACGFVFSGPAPGVSADPAQIPPPSPLKIIGKTSVLFLLFLAGLFVFGIVAYNVYFWFEGWRVERFYSEGSVRAPEVAQIEMSDGQVGRAITFFGRDGDEIFVPELGKSFLFIGGVAYVEVADSVWFANAEPEETESAVITIAPVLHSQGGNIIRLPVLELNVLTPVSPLRMISPAEDVTSVITSLYTLSFHVVPGSQVLINAEDVTDVVNHEGLLEAPINVDPVGDNTISIFVSTPNHKQTRKEIILHRAPQTINLEPSVNLDKRTTRSVFTVTGVMEPGANIVVDTRYVENSIRVRPTGDFSFQARLSSVGNNTITFHAQMDGRQDQYVSVSVYYVPPLNDYSRRAWRLDRQSDYDDLVQMSDIWTGRVFLCAGSVTQILPDTNPARFAINVAGDGEEPRYVVVENQSDVGAPILGQKYRAYSDVAGLVFYENHRVPLLICRYLLDPQ